MKLQIKFITAIRLWLFGLLAAVLTGISASMAASGWAFFFLTWTIILCAPLVIAIYAKIRNQEIS